MADLPEPFESPAAFLRALEHDTGGLVSYVDADERIRFASRELVEYFGLPREQVIGSTLRELHGEENYAKFGHWMRRGLAGEDTHYERESVNAEGRASWISASRDSKAPT